MSSITKPENVSLQPIRTRPSKEFRLSSRRLSREFPVAETPFDVYYGESTVGIPFLWESRPGTPKINVGKYALPPLTPPPSFHSTPNSRKPLKKQSRSTNLIIPKINIKKGNPDQSSPSESTTSSSSLSPWSSNRHRVSSPPRMSIDSRYGGRNEEDECESPVSTLCFGGARRHGAGRSPGCSSSIIRLLLRDFS